MSSTIEHTTDGLGEQIIDLINKRIQTLKEQADAYRVKADVYQKYLEGIKCFETSPEISFEIHKNCDRVDNYFKCVRTDHFLERKQTQKFVWSNFSDLIVTILKTDRRPMTTKELARELNSFMHKGYDSRFVSSMLIYTSKKPNTIRRFKIEGRKFHDANVWGLTSWFEGENLNKYYLRKIEQATPFMPDTAEEVTY